MYQRIDDLVAAAREGNAAIEHFECSVFDGMYVTGDISEQYLSQLAQTRQDSAKLRRLPDLFDEELSAY